MLKHIKALVSWLCNTLVVGIKCPRIGHIERSGVKPIFIEPFNFGRCHRAICALDGDVGFRKLIAPFPRACSHGFGEHSLAIKLIHFEGSFALILGK